MAEGKEIIEPKDAVGVMKSIMVSTDNRPCKEFFLACRFEGDKRDRMVVTGDSSEAFALAVAAKLINDLYVLDGTNNLECIEEILKEKYGKAISLKVVEE